MFIANNNNATQLRPTSTRTAYYDHSFTVFGLNLWNSLLNHIKECISLSGFRWSLYNHSFQKYFIIFPILSALIFVHMHINSINCLSNIFRSSCRDNDHYAYVYSKHRMSMSILFTVYRTSKVVIEVSMITILFY